MKRTCMIIAMVVAASANSDHLCPSGLKVEVFTDSKCETADAKLTKEWQAFWDGIDIGKCNWLGSDAGYAFDYGCYDDGFHTTYYSDDKCGQVQHVDVDRWGECSKQGKIFAKMTRRAAAEGGHEAARQDGKVLISFPGAVWVENNDPVMGGQSHGNWSVVDKSYGHFQGTVKNVSFLHAPGFCRAMTISPMLKDASEYINGGLTITARTSTPAYKGFKLSFGTLGAPRHHGGHEIQGSFKSNFIVPASKNGEWQTIHLKFNEFSADWSDYTGECSTKDPDGYQHQCCSKETASVCPNANRLKLINSFNIWAEGAEGDFDMEIKEIAATMALGSSSVILV